MNRRLLSCAGALFIATAIAQAARAQDTSPTPSGVQTGPGAPAPKKVWTNDDVTDLRANSPMPPPGNPSASANTSERQASAVAARKDAKWYHDQIEKLQNQLPPIERKIADLQAAIDGKPTGDSQASTRPTGVRGGTWQDDLARLQQKHDEIAAHITELRDQARHAGIPASALP